ncbi:peptidoglycan DD-metalloendopeptidase family protein [Oscillibacter sp. 1-3]|uniref:peptidoglycan DD-metalloendopeptidase family protein n=1 Tax=Oscillibacter sp. 1-3 TaxID=1235797 RepID=UPI000334A44D|nr:peptidoglycan DD-metalloendopeptidase family protein [Oscillibacter sp. 1-3]EOS65546.1 hypothetical protein C816_02333 [Oscillibacter sp. 1-3]
MSQRSRSKKPPSGGRRAALPREERREERHLAPSVTTGATAGLYSRGPAPKPPVVTSETAPKEHAVEDRLRRTAKRRAAIPAWEETGPRAAAGNSQPPRRRSAEPRPTVTWYQAVLWNLKRVKRRWRHLLREKQASRFPESNRFPIQILLLIWGIIPMWGSLLEERLWGRRQRAISRGSPRQERPERSARRVLYPLLFLGGTACIALIALFFSTYTYGTTVSYDGEVIAVMSSQSAAEEVRRDLEQVTARTLGESFTIDDSLIQYSSGLLRRQDLVDPETYAEDLSQEVGLVTAAYCLYVDGEFIGATPYAGALDELLKQLKAAGTDEDTISCDFAESVDIKEEYVPSDEIMNLGYLAETLYSTKTAEVTYEVQKGDTWSEIAEAHSLSSKELEALNPGYDINKLQIGEILTMSASVPYLTRTVVQKERYVAEVNYDVEYTDDASMYKGDTKVTSKGVFGAADVVANVTYVNGEEVERTVLSSVTLREPVTEQQLRGTMERPTWYPTGTFRWPVTGRITSRFGGRKSPGGIGSTNHQGIDIAASRGTPVCAADGGTVTYSGWMGGYGYLVEIDHGNGYKTRYGHNSSLTVSVGQHVYKGQQIARVGSTGNSTGNHCHFEVRYNGVARNPLNYLP